MPGGKKRHAIRERQFAFEHHATLPNALKRDRTRRFCGIGDGRKNNSHCRKDCFADYLHSLSSHITSLVFYCLQIIKSKSGDAAFLHSGEDAFKPFGLHVDLLCVWVYTMRGEDEHLIPLGAPADALQDVLDVRVSEAGKKARSTV